MEFVMALSGKFYCPAPDIGHFGSLWVTLGHSKALCLEGVWGGPLSYVSLGDRWGYYSE